MSNFNNDYSTNSKKMSNILFRADSSSKIGLGHIMRDLVLASKYKNSNITFATQDLDGNINHKIKDSGYKVKILKSNSKKELVKLVENLNIDLLVIDHYKIDYKKEKYIKEKTGVKILSFDDTYEKHYCDILLNHNIGANKKRYKKLVPTTCKILCGSKYTLIRDEFIKEKAKKYKINKNFTFFIAMGGADTANLNKKILKILKKFKNIHINIISTDANKNLKELKNYCKNKKGIKLYINSNKIAKIMKKSDLAIVTPSVTVNEIKFLKIPFIAIKTASNQKYIYKYLKKNKFIVLNKFSANKLSKLLKKSISNS